jgi:hypothetical protein
MPRRQAVGDNKLMIQDNVSGDEVGFFYRMPTTAERQGYASMAVQRVGKKIKMNQAGARLKYGLAVITDVVPGSFERRDEHGQWVELTREYEGWKEWLKEHAADLVELLAAHVYEASCELIDSDEDEGDALGK